MAFFIPPLIFPCSHFLDSGGKQVRLKEEGGLKKNKQNKKKNKEKKALFSLSSKKVAIAFIWNLQLVLPWVSFWCRLLFREFVRGWWGWLWWQWDLSEWQWTCSIRMQLEKWRCFCPRRGRWGKDKRGSKDGARYMCVVESCMLVDCQRLAGLCCGMTGLRAVCGTLIIASLLRLSGEGGRTDSRLQRRSKPKVFGNTG